MFACSLSRPNWNQVESELNPLDNRYKYPDYADGMYYMDPYKANISNLADNFTMMNMNDDSMRNAAKPNWAINDKLNMNNEVYSVEAPHHDGMKQNGSTHSDYYKELYAMQQHSQYSEQLQDYGTYGVAPEQNVDTGEIWDKRKETTSFEHEQPSSSSIAR